MDRELPRVLIVVALGCEARPIVSHYRLERTCEGAFPVYQDGSRAVVVSGPGKANAAAAVGLLHAACGFPGIAAWLNVGTGGHRNLPVGTAVLAVKITEASSGRSWYPPPVVEDPPRLAPVLTVDRVEQEYAADAVHEMEAAAFAAVALRLGTAELVHALKVISDGRGRPVGELDAREVERLVEGRLDVIDATVRSLEKVQQDLAMRRREPPGLPEITAAARFTVAEERRLRRLLERLEALEPGKGGWKPALARSVRARGVVRARDVLHRLEQRLDHLSPPVLHVRAGMQAGMGMQAGTGAGAGTSHRE